MAAHQKSLSAAHDVGLLASIVAAMGCPACFPALASLGAAAGLGFLGAYEGLFIHTLLPAFALLALAANLLGWFAHHQWRRTALGVLGPLLVLAAVAVMRTWGVRTGWLLYPGLVIMAIVAVWDLTARGHRRCAVQVPVSPRDPHEE